MKKNSKLFSLLFVVSILFGCQSAMDEHYKVPEWLKGSAWQVLDGRGDYTIFLKGVEIAGFRPMMEGKSILTVMAPNDAAFREYLSANGFSDISDMSIDQVKKLIGFHLLYYSYNKEKMINFRPEGDQASDESKMINAGMYYKFRSRSQDAPTKVIDSTGVERTIYHLERFLPVFSYQFFQTKRIDAKANYEFFYPNSTWTGGDGFNVSNATVKEYQIIADNGYIYAIDRVLEPLETIYTVLSKNPNYSVFYGLYDAYTAYLYDATLSTNYGKAAGVDSLYLHTHGGDLPPIANEWPTTSYQNVSALARQSFSIFAPSNAALNDFFQRYWQIGGYSSLIDVDRLAMQYLLL
ncbi:MAG: fasciclin domain-containing protein, partial [Paludibacter sp.]|nr:fasciclin domain-containing protein [Paludibacter sp.]